MSVELRPYQQVLIDQVRAAIRNGSRAPLMVLPTGGGKTICFSYIAANAMQRGTPVGIFVHRAELVDQVCDTLKLFNVAHGVIAAGSASPRRAGVYVVSVQTYARRVPQVPKFGLAIVDEAHHAVAGSTWAVALAHSPGAVVLGVTATPERLDGRGLGDTFDTLIEGPTVSELIEIEALAPYRLFAPGGADLSAVHSRMGDYIRGELSTAMDRPSITGNAVSHYRRYSNGKRAVAFCCSVEHAANVAAEFMAGGITAVAIDGRMDKALRRQIVRDFQAGLIHVLTSCDLISEGFDCPGIEAGFFLRPTQSLGLYLQQVGRILRTAPGKTAAMLFDHSGNWQRHGLPDDERAWSLEGRVSGKKKPTQEIPAGRQCALCYAVSPPSATICVECGKAFVIAARSVEERDGTLSEVDTAAVRQRAPEQVERLRQQATARSIDALIDLGRMRGMKNPEGWAKHVWAAREQKRAKAPCASSG